MRERRKKRPWLAALILLLSMALGAWSRPAAATCMGQRRTVIPVGRTVGIKLFAHGVMVVGLSENGTGAACGLKQGDVITCINGTPVNSIEEAESALSGVEGTLDIQASRSGRALELTLEDPPSDGEGGCKLGAWIRDSMAGIGTVTFYDPATGVFGALGHGINDVDTGLLMPLRTGSVMPSAVSGVLCGAGGAPGELHGSFDLTRDVGSLTTNTDRGIFGRADGAYFTGQPTEVALPGELHTGAAVILANVEGEQVESFDVEILRVYPGAGRERQSLMLRVTDERLLQRTGGIVQGMSGSPILQDGRLVGAVTHVLVDDPQRGYGITIGQMLDQAP